MELTLEIIKNWELDVFDTLSKISEYIPPYPKSPIKPKLETKHSKEDVLNYAKLLESYEKNYEEYKFHKSLYDTTISELDYLRKEFIKDYVGFYEIVPKDKQSKVWWKAWEDGHSDGWNSVYYQLDSLVELFS